MPWTCSSRRRGLQCRPSCLGVIADRETCDSPFASNAGHARGQSDLGVVDANPRAREEGQQRPPPGRSVLGCKRQIMLDRCRKKN